MLENIEYIFPENEENKEIFEILIKLFKDIPYVTIIENKEIHIISSNLKPKTIFKIDSNISDIQLNIGDSKYSGLLIGNRNYKDGLEHIKRIKPKDIINRLEGHIKRIDHTGVDLPTIIYSIKEWEELLKYFSEISNIYNYPSGEPWPFVLPADESENKTEITNFNILREPRFELVYDKYTDRPTIHIDFETDLTKSEVEELFPKEHGEYFVTLENFYKAIYLEYNGYIDIRFDVRFKAKHNNFETGEWFVKKGKRIL